MISILSGSNNSALTQVMSSASTISVTNEQTSIIESDLVMRSVVKNLNLDNQTNYSYFPVFGRYKAQGYNANIGAHNYLAKTFFGLNSYAWGGEIIQVSKLEVPESWFNLAIKCKYLGDYKVELILPSGKKIIGDINKEIIIENLVKVKFRKLRANVGLNFTITKLPMDVIIHYIQDSLIIQESNKDTTLLSLYYKAGRPDLALDTLSEVIFQAKNINSDLSHQEVTKIVHFLSNQLDVVNFKIKQASNNLTNYMRDNAANGIDKQYESYLIRLNSLQSSLLDLQNRYFKLSESFTHKDAKMSNIKHSIQLTKDEISTINEKIKRLPEKSAYVETIEKDLKSLSLSHEAILSSLNQFSAVANEHISPITIIDRPTLNPKPINKSLKMVLVLFMFLGAMLGCLLILFFENIIRGVSNKDQLLLIKNGKLNIFELFHCASIWVKLKYALANANIQSYNIQIPKLKAYQYYNLISPKGKKATSIIGLHTFSNDLNSNLALFLFIFSKNLSNESDKNIKLIFHSDLNYQNTDQFNCILEKNLSIEASIVDLSSYDEKYFSKIENSIIIFVYGNLDITTVHGGYIQRNEHQMLLIEKYKTKLNFIDEYLLLLNSRLALAIDDLLLF